MAEALPYFLASMKIVPGPLIIKEEIKTDNELQLKKFTPHKTRKGHVLHLITISKVDTCAYLYKLCLLLILKVPQTDEENSSTNRVKGDSPKKKLCNQFY